MQTMSRAETAATVHGDSENNSSVVCQVKHTCIMTELSSQNVHICFFVFTPAHVEQQNIFVL